MIFKHSKFLLQIATVCEYYNIGIFHSNDFAFLTKRVPVVLVHYKLHFIYQQTRSNRMKANMFQTMLIILYKEAHRLGMT